ncbi:unnamed protein product [Larinioides sclopetarius]|uniref:Uncharacterized protein n=1 Tax=Larinioides sclopetarius TaxID=280406 RepID=A0AAV2B692_9ARAC
MKLIIYSYKKPKLQGKRNFVFWNETLCRFGRFLEKYMFLLENFEICK